MTNEKAMQLLQRFIEDCKKEKDCFLVVHFSRSEDKFRGVDNCDWADTVIVVNELKNRFNLDYEVLHAMFNREEKEVTETMKKFKQQLIQFKVAVMDRRRMVPEATERALLSTIGETIDELQKHYREIL